MADPKDYFELFEDLTKMERMMISINKYNRSRGGGVLWIIFYWLLYIFSFYGITSGINLFMPNISKSIGFMLFIIVGFLLFLSIGCFLMYGVYHQMSVMRTWYKQLFRDYRNMIDRNARDLIDESTRPYPSGVTWQKQVTDLRNSLFTFENKYFPKKDE